MLLLQCATGNKKGRRVDKADRGRLWCYLPSQVSLCNNFDYTVSISTNYHWVWHFCQNNIGDSVHVVAHQQLLLHCSCPVAWMHAVTIAENGPVDGASRAWWAAVQICKFEMKLDFVIHSGTDYLFVSQPLYIGN